jgi:hypothetical protein
MQAHRLGDHPKFGTAAKGREVPVATGKEASVLVMDDN